MVDFMKRLIEKLAANLCENTDITEKNRAARLLSHLPDHELDKRGLCRDKLRLGGVAYPWNKGQIIKQDNDLEQLIQVISQQPNNTDLKAVNMRL